MLKFGAPLNDSKKIHGTKSVLSGNPDSTVALDGADLIPIDFGGRLVTPTISINELGKQLLKAATEGNVDDIKALLTKGAPFTADWLGTSPLHMAAHNSHLEITEILLRAGISKDARTKVDRTPLHMAAFEGHLQIVDTLVQHGADIDCRDMLGMTPLHWAVQNGHSEIVQYLINSGAQVDVQNKFNLTPLIIAEQIERLDIVELIYNKLTDSSMAAQNLVIQLAAEDIAENNEESQDLSGEMELENSNHESIIIPIEPSMMSQFDTDSSELREDLTQSTNEEYFQEPDQEMIETENEQLVENVNVNTANFSDSLKLLQEHGITMLQTDENEDGNILNTVMESGHSVVLTDIGKEVLNSVKQSEQQQLQMEKKIVQVTPEEFLAMANGSMNNNNRNVFKQLKVLPVKNSTKRIVMKKNKVIPVSSVTSIRTGGKSPSQQNSSTSRTDMELVMKQLIEAKKTIEEYKVKLQKKEQEAERYKLQLKLLMGTS